MPQVEAFSVGAFGETNRAVHAFLNVLADKGSDAPERFGCCHGKEQAKGVVAQFLGRRLGRTLVIRGAVRFRNILHWRPSVGSGGSKSPERHRERRATWGTSCAPLVAPGSPTTRLAPASLGTPG